MKLNEEIIKIFDEWAKLKIKVHVSDKKVYPKIKEIWWVNVGQNVGSEINGKNNNFERPVVVLKVFNNVGFLVAPISSKNKDDKYLIKFNNINEEVNVVNLSQIRAMSDKRFIRKIGVLDSEVFNKIKDIFKDFV
jgi:mRNA interferase MazF